ncbi:hypothetical protein E2C01_076352 [Portunus trituberculatus]|uniref:Uncharacterized protein n=1 Tax=Portunus trituberculatus TaxID=210409 RepID=A0A5B7I8I7_PORTR|nr:hypothetical protein [Portunus trituberculatus]
MKNWKIGGKCRDGEKWKRRKSEEKCINISSVYSKNATAGRRGREEEEEEAEEEKEKLRYSMRELEEDGKR